MQAMLMGPSELAPRIPGAVSKRYCACIYGRAVAQCSTCVSFSFKPVFQLKLTHGFSNRCHCIGLGLKVEGVFGGRAAAGITILSIVARCWAADATRRGYRCNH